MCLKDYVMNRRNRRCFPARHAEMVEARQPGHIKYEYISCKWTHMLSFIYNVALNLTYTRIHPIFPKISHLTFYGSNFNRQIKAGGNLYNGV